jgi:ABC-2 type transport system permease protein
MIWASRLLLAVVVFWAPQVELDVLSSALWQCGRYPIQIYRQPIRFALTYLLPLAYIATMPAYVLTHGQDLLASCLVGLLIVGGLVGIVWGLWQAGLRRYSSATS